MDQDLETLALTPLVERRPSASPSSRKPLVNRPMAAPGFITKRSTWGLVGASGQFENRVTSGIDNSAKKCSASSICGARKRKQSVARLETEIRRSR